MLHFSPARPLVQAYASLSEYVLSTFRPILCIATLVCAGLSTRCAWAQQARAAASSIPSTVALPTIQVNASRMRVPAFDVPASLSVIAVAPSTAGQAGVNLSESLRGVPGILARDRQNYAQDEQISIRGYGARSTFGVRSIRLYVDGIPATLPDGQGQVSHINWDSADRVEVLRGPFSVLYGNAAGGVVQVWTADGSATPQTTIGFNGGSYDTFRYSLDTRGTVGAVDYHIAGSEFLSGGYRQHARVHRESDNAKFGIDLGSGRKLTVILNRLYQPTAQDELGLTRAQIDADPRQATAVAAQYNTRKSIHQTQLGLIYEQTLSGTDLLRAMTYYGQRSIEQYQAIPVRTQANPLQSGGVVAPNTNYGGADLRWTHSDQFLGRDDEFVLGASADYQRQRRLGYNNFVGDQLGVTGALRRDENDNVTNVASYAQWYWHFADQWSLLLGLRHDDVRFAEHDFYITATNPDDSGNVHYSATTPVAGLTFRPVDNLRIYASFGRGFETPSYNELGYRSDGRSGLALNLRPSKSLNDELGLKWQLGRGLEFDAAAFRSDTRNELAIATNENGRSTYQNVGATRRQGYEVALSGQLAPAWQLSAGFTHLQARFRSTFFECTSTPCPTPTTRVNAGQRIPGVPDAYGSLRLQHGTDTLGWREGIDLEALSAVAVNDTNTQHAAGYATLGVDAGYVFALGANSKLDLSLRIDNVTDRRYIGSVIVNDANGRYFEPGPNRSYMFGARLRF